MKKPSVSRLAQKAIIPAGLLAITLGMLGGQWDSWSHVKQGHVVFALPHLVIIGGLALFTLSGVLALVIIILSRREIQRSEKRGLFLVAAGGLLIPVALVLDELSHAIWGLDQTAWSAPHALMFLCVASILFGLAVFCACKKTPNSSRRGSYSALPTLFFATILLLALFSLGDFDQPHMAFVKDIRAGYAYVISATGMSTFVFLAMAFMLKRVGVATIAAFLAWGFHAGAGYLVGEIGGFSHTFPPYPLIIPALAFDLWLLISIRGRFHTFSFRSLLLAALFTASVCYAVIVLWVELYTHLPQQSPEKSIYWLVWYFQFVPIISLSSALAAFLLSRWILKYKNT